MFAEYEYRTHQQAAEGQPLTADSLDEAYRRLYHTKSLNGTKVFDEIENQEDSSEQVLYLVEFLRRSLDGKHGRYRESLR